MMEGRKLRSNPIPAVLCASAFAFLAGVCFPVQVTPKVSPWSMGLGGANSSTFVICSNILLDRFWKPSSLRNSTSAVEGPPILQAASNSNTTSEHVQNQKIVAPATKPKGEERLPPKIQVPQSDLHLRRLWGSPREDTPTRKYLLVLTIGYNERVNVNATVHKFSENFDVVLFHYDGRTTEWDEFEWSKQAVHVSARGQTKWWYAKRFMHPSVVAPYDYIFLWDEDLGVEAFDAEEYLKIVRKHRLEISQPGLDTTRGPKPFFDITARRNGSQVHKSTLSSPGDKCTRAPCSGFVEVMAPVFSREAWTCVWHMVQNDLVHGHGLDWNFWRCVDEPAEHIGVVDAQYVVHHAVVTLGSKGGSRSNVTARQRDEFNIFNDRMRNAERAQAAAVLPPPAPPASTS